MREGIQDAVCVMLGREKDNPDSAAKSMQWGDAAGGQPRTWWWAEASIWTERMVSALGNGVKGGKWFSLADKAIRPTTLEIAWRKVERNKGAAGVDGQSVERFAAGGGAGVTMHAVE